MSPRLGVLHNIPFAIPFELRVSIFRNFILNDRRSRGIEMFGRRPQTWITVRRGSIAQDGFDKLQDADLRAPISITFIDQFGHEEYVAVLHHLTIWPICSVELESTVVESSRNF